MGTLNNKDFQTHQRRMKMKSKGYDTTYNCTLINAVPVKTKCNHPLFHLGMCALIAVFFYLSVTTKYKPVEQYQTVASIAPNI
jgi:hypothetical protein